jgi:uncharacterized membrane protein
MPIVARRTSAFERRVQLGLIILIGAGILHIVATLAAPMMTASTPYARLAAVAPLHTFVVLPPVTPQSQPLPFLGPDARYGLCRYDTSNGPIDIVAQLLGKGWSLSLYTRQGDNTYTAVGQDGQSTVLRLQLTPVTERFLGLTPEARGQISETRTNEAPLSLPATSGIAILRAPDRGIAYRRETEAAMRRASCAARPF